MKEGRARPMAGTNLRRETASMEQRKSNMELLRLVSIAMIVVFHCAFKSGFSFEPGFSVNKLVVKVFWMLGELGVNLFMLISGYFMVNGRFKVRKLVRLLAEAQFYWWLTLLIGSRVGACTLPQGKKELLLAFFPVTLNRCGWFLTVYVLIYLLSPYLNLLIRAMDEKTYRKFLLTVLGLFCVIPTFFGFFFNTTETMLYYNRFIWLTIMYFSGAYIYIYMQNQENQNIFTRKRAVRLTTASSGAIVLSILAIDRFSGFFERLGTTEPAYFWPPNTIPMLCLSVGVFVWFLHIELPYRPVINTLASTTLGIYLMHDGILNRWLWQTVFRCAEYQESPFLAFRILGTAAVIFIVGAAVDLARQAAERRTLGRLLERVCRDGGIDGGRF